MKTFIRGIKAALFAFTAILCGNVFAATPVVVWDGDFNATTKEADGDTYTLTVNGNTIAEDGSTITIADTDRKGVYIDWTQTTDAATIIVKYKGLTTTDKTYPMGLLGFSSASFANVDGLAAHDSNCGVKAYWKNTYFYSWKNNEKTITMDGAEATLALRYSSAGTYGRIRYSDDFQELFSVSTVMGGGTYAMNGAVVGGTRQLTYGNVSHNSALGMQIEAIALFKGALTDDEIADYQFPSETAVEPEKPEESEVVEFDGTLPSATQIERFQNSDWTGTVWLKNMTVASFDLAQYGNANSTIRLTGFKGYSPNSNDGSKGFDGTVELVDEGDTKAWTITDTYGSTYYVAKLTGDGTFTTQNNKGGPARYAFKNVDGFTGSIDLANGGRSVTIGEVTQASDYAGVSGENAIKILSGASATIAAGKTWHAANGIIVDGTLKFTEDSSTTGQQVTRWNTGNVSGSGTIDLSEAKGISGNNLRICFKGANHDFTGDITVPANVNFVFAKADATSSEMQFSGGGYICVETTNATIGGTWTGAGAYMKGEPTTATLKLAGGTMQVSNQFIIVGNPSFEVVEYGEAPALTIAAKLRNNNSKQFAIAFPTTIDPTEDETPIIKWNTQENVNGTTFTSATTPVGYDLEYVSSDEYKGLMLNARVGITWQGGEGASLTEEGSWSGGSITESAEDGRFIFPANETTQSVTVDANTPKVSALAFAGDYKLSSKGEKTTLSLGILNLKTGAKLTVENLTIVADELRIQSVDQLVLGPNARIESAKTIAMAQGQTLVIDTSASLQLALTPSFDGNSTIKISNAADLVAGTYPLITWMDTIPGISGYGMPKLDVEGYEGGLEVCLVPEADKLWLQVVSAEQAARKPLVIMPWGDSITEGTNGRNTGANYRIQLCQKLSLAGYNVKTVGYWNTNAKTPAGTYVDQSHPEWCSHSGRGSERLGAQNSGNGSFYDSWANALDQAGNPDVVLMHCGINDMLNNVRNIGYEEAYVYFTNIVQKVLASRPTMKLVMTTPMCCEYGHSDQKAEYEGDGKKDTNKNFVKPLHDKIVEEFWNGVQTGEIEGIDKDRLFFADMYEAVMPRWYGNQPETHLNIVTDGGGDHCHPDWNGHSIMAETWLAEIKKAFPQDANGDYTAPSMSKTPVAVAEEKLGAANKSELADYRKGFKKVRVLKPTGNEKFAKDSTPAYDWSDTTITDDAEIEKVGYFVEYVVPSETENVHRWVWVDMDAFGDKTVAAAGVPTKGITQQVVTGLHVCGNHPAVYNTAADATDIEGYLEFGPNDYGSAAAGGTGAPTKWMNVGWNDKFGTGTYGAMQVHRKFNEYRIDPETKQVVDPNSDLGNRRAQVVFAYNGWARSGSANNEFGIGNFGQHFSGSSLDWTGLGSSATMNASVLQSKTIEIWVKVKGDTGITEWTEVVEGTTLDDVVSAETSAAIKEANANSSLTAKDIADWAAALAEKGETISIGSTIPVNALILNCAPGAEAISAAEKEVVVDEGTLDAILEAVAELSEGQTLDLSKIDVPAAVKAKYPMATIEVIEAKELPSTDTAKFFKLQLKLK